MSSSSSVNDFLLLMHKCFLLMYKSIFLPVSNYLITFIPEPYCSLYLRPLRGSCTARSPWSVPPMAAKAIALWLQTFSSA